MVVPPKNGKSGLIGDLNIPFLAFVFINSTYGSFIIGYCLWTSAYYDFPTNFISAITVGCAGGFNEADGLFPQFKNAF